MVERIPALLAIGMTSIIGILGYLNGTDIKDLYIRMIISILIFYIIGKFASKKILKILDEVIRKEELRRQKEFEQEVARRRAEKERRRREREEGKKGSKVDYSVDDSREISKQEDGEFVPLNDLIEENDNS